MWKGFLIVVVLFATQGCKHTLKVETKTPLYTVKVYYNQGD